MKEAVLVTAIPFWEPTMGSRRELSRTAAHAEVTCSCAWLRWM